MNKYIPTWMIYIKAYTNSWENDMISTLQNLWIWIFKLEIEKWLHLRAYSKNEACCAFIFHAYMMTFSHVFFFIPCLNPVYFSYSHFLLKRWRLGDAMPTLHTLSLYLTIHSAYARAMQKDWFLIFHSFSFQSFFWHK